MLLKVYRRRHTKSDNLFLTQKHKDTKKDVVAPASRGQFRASRPKPAADARDRKSFDQKQSPAHRGNSAGRRIEPARGGCYL
jgi:hypothetical protein